MRFGDPGAPLRVTGVPLEATGCAPGVYGSAPGGAPDFMAPPPIPGPKAINCLAPKSSQRRESGAVRCERGPKRRATIFGGSHNVFADDPQVVSAQHGAHE